MSKIESVNRLNQHTTSLGIEIGSTRIKAVLINDKFIPIASGSYEWENSLKNGFWTYDMEEVWRGVQYAFKQLNNQFEELYGTKITKVGAIGFSGMMHGYLAFDKKGKQLVPFRTWRNTTTEEASIKLTEEFEFNIPHRWSIAHLYQAILNNEQHVHSVDFITTLAGYVHWKLTGEKVIGVGEAAGMFPVDSKTVDFDKHKINQFNTLIENYSFDWKLETLLPKVLSAGQNAGKLTSEGAKLLDLSGNLEVGIPFCPPEGDAGAGMVATNSISQRTGNVSAGTSIFSMIVLEEELSTYYKEIDIVTTPNGNPVAMVHCNNFTTEINAWSKLFGELIESLGFELDKDKLFRTIFEKSLEADEDGGKLISCNYYSGEPITGLEEGRPLFIQMPDSKLSLPNFMRTQIYSALATLKLGMDILTLKENVKVDQLLGHGGFFKTEFVGQKLMADALNVPVSVMNTAGEGGPWGMAILAAYLIEASSNFSLENYLDQIVFINGNSETVSPTEAGTKNFNKFMKRYNDLLDVEKFAVKAIL